MKINKTYVWPISLISAEQALQIGFPNRIGDDDPVILMNRVNELVRVYRVRHTKTNGQIITFEASSCSRLPEVVKTIVWLDDDKSECDVIISPTLTFDELVTLAK